VTKLRDLLVWAALWAVYLILIQPLITSAQGVAVAWIGGGIAAGLLIVLEVRRWWPLLLVTAPALAIGYRGEIEGWALVLQVAVDLVAIVAFARVVRAHRRDLSGLGADVPWVAFAAIGAAAIRLLPALVIGWASDGTAGYSAGAAAQLGLSTVVGLIAGSATVLGLGRWTWGAFRLRENRELLLGGAVLTAVLVLVFVTPFGSAVPGAQFLVVPLLLASAVRYPVPLTAFLTGLSVLAISMAAASGTGPYDLGQPATSEQVFATQVFLLVVTVSVFVLASVVSERRLAEEDARRSSAMLATVFRETPVPGAWVTLAADRYPVIREANPAFLALVGLSGDGVRGVRLSSLLSPTEPADVMDLESGRDLHTMGPDGTARWLRPTLSRRFADPTADPSDRHEPDAEHPEEYAVLVLEDVTADRVSEELLRQQARRDSLTGLPNRAALIERLEDALADASEYSPAGLLILDIDDLKVVNNGLGHLVGDQLIIQMGQRFAEVLAPRDLLVRTGGDEFAVLRPQPVAGDPLDDLAQRLLLSAAEPFLLDHRPVSVSVSIGAAESDASTELPGDLLRGADIALQRAKHGGRRQSARFEPGEDKPALERMGIEELLRRSLDNEELVCMYQPITLISTGRVVAAETLVRLRDGAGEIVPPSAFLPLAAELGLLGALTDQVLRQACAAAARWMEAGHEIRVAFNAPPQWLNSAAVAAVEQALADFGIPPAIMTVEVTEEETLSAGRAAVETLTELRSLGLHVAIDDFGTGYAGLDSFRSVPADLVKVDRSFVDEMLRNDEDFELVRSMLDLIYRFGKLAVAEGVETKEQLDALGSMGCEYAQGFLLARPLPFEEFPAGEVLPRTLPLQPV
jgi:diguanylate cyclase (GGDEF)-like protein